jgi:hypothetical protein
VRANTGKDGEAGESEGQGKGGKEESGRLVRKAIEMKERFSNVKQRLGKSIPWRDHTHGGEITEASEMSSPQKKFIKLRQQIEQNRGGQQPQRQTSETKKGGEDDVRRVFVRK